MSISKNFPDSWTPPFCPNPNCIHHNHSQGPWPYKKTGFFKRHTPPFRIQRFTCKTCRRSFSTQTFSTTYYQKRPDLDRLIFMKTVGGMANRQNARDPGAPPAPVHRPPRPTLSSSSAGAECYKRPNQLLPFRPVCFVKTPSDTRVTPPSVRSDDGGRQPLETLSPDQFGRGRQRDVPGHPLPATNVFASGCSRRREHERRGANDAGPLR